VLSSWSSVSKVYLLSSLKRDADFVLLPHWLDLSLSTFRYTDRNKKVKDPEAEPPAVSSFETSQRTTYLALSSCFAVESHVLLFFCRPEIQGKTFIQGKIWVSAGRRLLRMLPFFLLSRTHGTVRVGERMIMAIIGVLVF
jgi:hypothetical protein